MKKLILYISFLITYLNPANVQITHSAKGPILVCDIVDINVKREVQLYVKRNFKKENEQGVVILRLPDSAHDKANFEFYISEIMTKKDFKAKPAAISMVSGHWVLLYGLLDANTCIKKSKKVVANIVEKSLIDTDIKKVDKNGNQTYLIFDPEIVKLTVKNNLVVLKKHLSTELDLTAKF